MKRKRLLLCAMVLILLSACKSPKNIAYFKDADSLEMISTYTAKPLTLKPDDKLQVLVKVQGDVQESLSSIFSMTSSDARSYITNIADPRSPLTYTVNDKGNIDFPVLGVLHVEGMTRSQVEELIKTKIINEGYAKDVAVNVTILNMMYGVLGEVAHPGRFEINKDQITVLDALAAAGDLTIYGKRENVKLLRKENGHQKIYTLNLTNASSVMASPAYFIQQDDIIYVEPNTAKSQNSEIGSMTTLWVSMTSIGVSLVSLLYNVLK